MATSRSFTGYFLGRAEMALHKTGQSIDCTTEHYIQKIWVILIISINAWEIWYGLIKSWCFVFMLVRFDQLQCRRLVARNILLSGTDQQNHPRWQHMFSFDFAAGVLLTCLTLLVGWKGQAPEWDVWNNHYLPHSNVTQFTFRDRWNVRWMTTYHKENASNSWWNP